MSDAVDHGITVMELAAMDQPIDLSHETASAFVGRTLRGPLNTPVLVRNFGEFRRRFGDLWSRSSLGPAVQQFFEHGGKNLYIVRVVNNAQGAVIRLPAEDGVLSLRALEPGSTECIRAAVDYDGIDPNNKELFNLTLQRTDAESGLVTDQEMFRKLSCREGADTFVREVLSASTIACAEHPVPGARPQATGGSRAGVDTTYADVNYIGNSEIGTDGSELSDYDLIGSRVDSRGLFALNQIDQLDVLYLPPPSKQSDIGPAALLAADRYCRERGAMLIVDPGTECHTVDEAIAAARQQGYASPNMMTYFPRVRHRSDPEGAGRIVGGALAGLLCKLDRTFGPWQPLDRQSLGLSRALQPSVAVDDDEARALIREGINVIAPGAAGRVYLTGSTTMARGSDLYRCFANLPLRRLCLSILNAIDRATRWAVFEKPDANLAEHVRGQVHAYLSALADLGAFVSDRILVKCDPGPGNRQSSIERGFTVMIVFQPIGSSKPISFTLHQSIEGYRVASTAFAPAVQDCA